MTPLEDDLMVIDGIAKFMVFRIEKALQYTNNSDLLDEFKVIKLAHEKIGESIATVMERMDANKKG